jgi:hypothetical protein
MDYYTTALVKKEPYHGRPLIANLDAWKANFVLQERHPWYRLLHEKLQVLGN